MLQNNYKGRAEKFQTNNETQKSVSARSCHSTEPQSRNPSHQLKMKKGEKASIDYKKVVSKKKKYEWYHTEYNTAFLSNERKNKFNESEQSHSSCDQNCQSFKEKLEISYKKQHSLENTIEEYMVQNHKLQSLVKQGQQKFIDLQK